MSKYVMVYTAEPVIQYTCHMFEMPDDFDESLLPDLGGADGVLFTDDILPVLQEVDRFGPTLVSSEVQRTAQAGVETVESYSIEDGA
jgi:hypothetical protein